MESFFEGIHRASIEKEALSSVFLIGSNNPGSEYPFGDGMLLRGPRVAKDNEAAIAGCPVASTDASRVMLRTLAGMEDFARANGH